MGNPEVTKTPSRTAGNSKQNATGIKQTTKIDMYTINTRSTSQAGTNKNDATGIEKSLSVIMGELQKINDNMAKKFKKEIDELKKNIEDKDKKWEAEKNLLWEHIDLMEDKIKKLTEGVPEKLSEDENNQLKEEKEKIQQQQARIIAEIEKMEQLKQKQLKIEKKNNIVIKGLIDTDDDPKQTTVRFIEEKFRVKVDAADMWLQGKDKKVVIVKLKKWETKEEIMKNKKVLLNTKIFIENDLTREEREVQRRIAQEAKEIRKNNHSVKVGYRKMCVDGKWLSWQQLKSNMEKKDF
ncbi:arginine and glutamate-rich protein 1-like [Bactrocera oleae]|uniref:arginine and glutamate-rich protein 1-like n=1 Tax=Bactrocera oleae TaxID=104688 RepID=UPI00387EC9BA